MKNFIFQSNFVIGLRKQIVELKNLINKKEENLKELKKNSNYLKVQELNVENEAYSKEIQKIQDFMVDRLEKDQQKKE